MAKLSYKATIFALSGTAAALSLICVAAYAIAPSATLRVFNLLFHGIDLATIAKPSQGFLAILAGLALMIVFAALTGALFVTIYNKFQE